MLIVLHTADLHLGRNRKYHDYLAQQSFMLEGILSQVVSVCKAHPNASVYLCVSGDIFDRNQSTTRSEFVLFLLSFIEPLRRLKKAHSNLDVFLIDGNHDRTPNPDEPSVFSPVEKLFAKDFQMAVLSPRFSEDHSMLMIPYQGFTASEMRTQIRDSGARHVMAHECLNRMQTDTGWSPPRNQDKYIEIEDVLPDTEVLGVYLGDIHRCQAMDKKKVCWYSGSPVTLDFGHRLPKGVLHHYFEDGRRVKDPELVAIDDPRIRVHQQLGKIERIEDIPWGTCYQYLDRYLHMVITPEVKAEISRKIDGFFQSKHVSYDSVDISTEEQVEQEVSESEEVKEHYEGLVKRWVEDKLDDYPVDLRDEFLQRACKHFEERG